MVGKQGFRPGPGRLERETCTGPPPPVIRWAGDICSAFRKFRVAGLGSFSLEMAP